MFNYATTDIELAERLFSPDCSVPFFQHELSGKATLLRGRLVNLYKVRERFLSSSASLFYWVEVLPDEQELECSCSWHRATGEMCQHIATVLLYKWFELNIKLPTKRLNHRLIDLPGLGDGPQVLRQAREIAFLQFDFDEASRARLVELRQRYLDPQTRQKWYFRS